MIAVSRASASRPPASARSSGRGVRLDGAQEAPIEGVVGVLQDDRRLAEPRDQPARGDAGGPRATSRSIDPRASRLSQSSTNACALARDSACQRRAGVEASRSHAAASLQAADGAGNGEGRIAVRVHHLAGQREMAGIDMLGSDRVGGANVLRRDQQALGTTPAHRRKQPLRHRQRPAEAREPGAGGEPQQTDARKRGGLGAQIHLSNRPWRQARTRSDRRPIGRGDWRLPCASRSPASGCNYHAPQREASVAL